MFSGSPLFILTLTCLTKDAENVNKMLKARLEKVPAAPIICYTLDAEVRCPEGSCLVHDSDLAIRVLPDCETSKNKIKALIRQLFVSSLK